MLLTILLVLIIVGLPNFLHVCKFIINTSEPKLSWNLILLLNISTCTNFQMFQPSDLSVLAIFTKLFFFLALQWVLLCSNQSQVRHFKSVWAVLIPIQMPAAKAQFRGQNTFFLQFTWFSWWLVSFFVMHLFYMRYTTFLDIFWALVNTNKTLTVFGDLLQH